MIDILDSFINFLKQEKNLTPNTIDSYKRDINQFLTYLSDKDINYINVKKITILNYMNDMKSSNKKQSTISRHLSSIKLFFQYLFVHKLIDNEPAYTLDAPKVEHRKSVTLSIKQVDKLLSIEFEKSVKGYRDKAIIEVLYATGLRVSELISLHIDDINFNYGFVYCKNIKERVIPIGSHAIVALKDYIKIRKSHKSSDYLFLNLRGKPLTRQGCWKIIKGYTDILKTDFAITPNILRKSFAQHMLENGADLRSVHEMLGYKNINSDELLSLASKPKIKEVYKKAHPRA